MNERELQSAVVECARLLGWRVAHFRPAETKRGWRTPVEADGAGFPDLVLVRDGRLLFVELKADRGRTRPEQIAWFDDLTSVAVENETVDALLWRPSDWTSGSIEAQLRG